MSRAAHGSGAGWRTVRESAVPGDSGIAVCHDWLTTLGGADKVAALLARHYEAEQFASFALRAELATELGIDSALVASRLNGVAASGRNWQYLLPLMPLFWRSLDLSDFEVVLTSSHAAVNAVRAPDAVRVCYCHTPMRYAWEWREEQTRLPGPARPLLRPVAAVFRQLDRRWSRGVDAYVANSRFIADRIRDSYGREATIVHPPIDVDKWTPGEEARGDHYLVAGRLVGYKRPMLAVRAAIAAGSRVVVAGDGPELAAIQALGHPAVTIERSPSDGELLRLYRTARALLFTGIEDFGMTLLEAQACGTPVVARAAGGALDSVLDGRTGTLVEGETVDDFSRVLADFDPASFDRGFIRAHAETFGPERFLAQMDDVIEHQRQLGPGRGGMA